ncbi:MAG: TldD/PmbA family protein [Candidatus Helarchaeota archaeon]
MKDFLINLIDEGLNDVDFIEIRVVESHNFIIRIVNGISREIVDANEKGIGIRAFKSGGWGFSCSNNYNKNSINKTLKNAVKLAISNEKKVKNQFKLKEFKSIHASKDIPIKINVADVDVKEKIDFVLDLDKQGKEFDNRIVNTNVLYMDGTIKEVIFNSFGSIVESSKCLVRTICVNYSSENGVRQRGYSDIGGTGGYEIVKSNKAQNLGIEASQQAIRLLKAKTTKAGTFRAILDPKLSSVFIHEAFGHCCEADAILSGESILENKMNEKIGFEKVNILDDPTQKGKYGSYFYDSEGYPAQKKILVENGILKNFLHDIETASRMNLKSPTGNARSESYQNVPIVRMSNIFIDKGDYSFEEMLEELKNGIYAIGWLYGYTDTAKGMHQFKASEAFLVENGKLTKLLRDCAISGMTLEVLENIIAVGKNLKFTPGTCGKSGQYVPVSDGGSHLLVENITFGGLS